MDSQHFEDSQLFPNNQYILYDGTSLRKDLIIEYSDMPSQQIQANIPYNSETRQLDLGLVLHNHLIETVQPGFKYQVFYYSNDFEYFVYGGTYPFQQLLLLGEEYISNTYLFIKLNRIHPPAVSSSSQTEKKKRKNDRTIKQMLQKVSQWRKIQQQNGVTFEQAAKLVQIPKKTLDDYFWHIKQGHTYGFDFQAHLNKKVGVIRKFVRENHKKEENSVKILQSFMKVEEEDLPEEQDDQEQQQYQSGQQ